MISHNQAHKIVKQDNPGYACTVWEFWRALASDRKSDRHLSLFFGGFYTINHNRTALLPSATERFRRSCLTVSRDAAIQIGPKSPSLGSISRAARMNEWIKKGANGWMNLVVNPPTPVNPASTLGAQGVLKPPIFLSRSKRDVGVPMGPPQAPSGSQRAQQEVRFPARVFCC